MALFKGIYGTLRVGKWLFNKVEDIDASLFLIFGGIIFKRGINMKIEVVKTVRLVDEVFKEKEGTHCGIGSRIDGNPPAFKRGKEVWNQMGGRGISHPDRLWEKF